MKKIFTLLTLFVSTLSFGQASLEAWTTNQAGTSTVVAIANGSEVEVTTTASSATLVSTETIKVKFKNNAATTNTYSVRRIDVQINPGAVPYFCFGDLGSCFSTSTTTPPTPADYSVLNPGSSTVPGSHLIADLDEALTIGYSAVRYKIFNVATGEFGADTLSFTVIYNKILSVSENQNVISHLSNVYPNPVANNATLNLTLKQESPVSVQVFNSLGALVYSANEQKLLPGKQKINVDCSGLINGIYFVTLNAGESKITKRMVINK